MASSSNDAAVVTDSIAGNSTRTDAPSADAPSLRDASGPADATDAEVFPPALQPCAFDTRVIYVEGDPGNNLVDGISVIAGDQAAWTSLLQSETMAKVVAMVPPGDDVQWGISLNAPFGTDQPLTAGTYDAGYPGRTTGLIDVLAAGTDCGQATGTFDIVELVAPAGDQVPISHLLASFDVQCGISPPGVHVRGCIRYEP